MQPSTASAPPWCLASVLGVTHVSGLNCYRCPWTVPSSRLTSQYSGRSEQRELRPLTAVVGRTELPERFDVLTKPVGQPAVVEATCGEIEHEVFLRIGDGIDLVTGEDEESLHGAMPDALVAIDERVALNQGQTRCRGLLGKSGVQVTTTECGFGLGDCRLKRTEVPNAGRAACRRQETPMEFDDLSQREVAHQARRRSSSSFFCNTRLAAASKSSSRVASRSATAARARSSGVRPRRSASRRRRSPCACDRSMVTFMWVLSRVAGPSTNMVERTGQSGRPLTIHVRRICGLSTAMVIGLGYPDRAAECSQGGADVGGQRQTE